PPCPYTTLFRSLLVRALLRELDYATDLRQEHVVAPDAVLDAQIAIQRHVPVLTVDGHGVLRLEQLDHLRELVAPGVAGDVHAAIQRAVHHIDAETEEIVDRVRDGIVVPRDRRGRHDDL